MRTRCSIAILAKFIVCNRLAIGPPAETAEAIAEFIEDELGGVPDEVQTPFWAAIVRSLRDSGRLNLTRPLTTIRLFVVGFIPFIGRLVGPALGLAGGRVPRLRGQRGSRSTAAGWASRNADHAVPPTQDRDRRRRLSGVS